MGEKVRDIVPEVASPFLVEGLRTPVRFYDLLALRLRARQIVSPDLRTRSLHLIPFQNEWFGGEFDHRSHEQTLNLYYR